LNSALIAETMQQPHSALQERNFIAKQPKDEMHHNEDSDVIEMCFSGIQSIGTTVYTSLGRNARLFLLMMASNPCQPFKIQSLCAGESHSKSKERAGVICTKS
jgi:hypothetical protein